MRSLWLFVLMLPRVLMLPLLGQVEPAGGNLPAQPIGPTDLLSISVYGAPELTRTVRVGDDGMIRLPMLREKIDARGFMPASLESRIADALSSEEILVDPAVTVTIAEYHSRPISVVGAVRGPVTFQALGKTTLLEAVARAQGFSEDAGAEIMVTRPAKNGQPAVTDRIPRTKLIDAADPIWNVKLEGGEEVRVPQVGRIFVVGNVKKPGTFRVEDGGQTTVLKAVAMAEGLSPYANKVAYVYRPAKGPLLEGRAMEKSPTEVVVDLGKIMDRKSQDVVLTANDVLYIPDNRGRRLTATAIEKAIGFAAGTASGALILGLNH